MGKHKLHVKDKKKASQLVIRVAKAERDAFVSLCDQLDTSAAREIRRFMRELVDAHSSEKLVTRSEAENAVIVDVSSNPPANEVATSPETDAKVDVPARDNQTDEVGKSKKKKKRAIL